MSDEPTDDIPTRAREPRPIEQIEQEFFQGFLTDPEKLLAAMAEEAGIELPENKLSPEEKARLDHLLMCYRKVLATQEGLIVVLHFLSEANAFDFVFRPNSEVYRRAALMDYANERMREICMAGSDCYTRVSQMLVRKLAWDSLPGAK